MSDWNQKVECCGNCAFWPLAHSQSEWSREPYGIGGHHTDGSVSECRKHAPIGIADGMALHGDRKFPTTRKSDFCGDFELRG